MHHRHRILILTGVLSGVLAGPARGVYIEGEHRNFCLPCTRAAQVFERAVESDTADDGSSDEHPDPERMKVWIPDSATSGGNYPGGPHWRVPDPCTDPSDAKIINVYVDPGWSDGQSYSYNRSCPGEEDYGYQSYGDDKGPAPLVFSFINETPNENDDAGTYTRHGGRIASGAKFELDAAGDWELSDLQSGYSIQGSGGVAKTLVHPDGSTSDFDAGGVLTGSGPSQRTTESDEDGRPVKVTERLNGVITRILYYVRVDDATPVQVRKRVTEETYSSDAGKRFATTLYVYYAGDHSDPDKRGRLWFIVQPEGVRRFLEHNGYEHGIDPADPGALCDLDSLTTVPDEDGADPEQGLKYYATTVYLDYDSQGRVTELQGDGSCGSCGGSGGGASGTTTHAYGDDANPNYPAAPTTDELYNVWKDYKRTTDPAGHRTVVFRNAFGNVVYQVRQVDDGGTLKHWVTHRIYESAGTEAQGDVIELRHPSACTGYTVSTDVNDWPDDVSADDTGTAGLVELTDYTFGAGSKVVVRRVRQGTADTQPAYVTARSTYSQHTVGSSDRWQLDSRDQYPEQTTNADATSRLTTSYDYDYYLDGGNETHAVQFKRVTHPTVSTANNGSNSATYTTHHYFRDTDEDLYYNDWTRHEDGSLSYRSQLLSNHRTKASIRDIETDSNGYADTDGDGTIETNGEDAQAPVDPWTSSRWTNTDGQSLRTEYAYDSRGRVEATTDPAGRTRVTAHVHQYEEVDDNGTDRQTTLTTGTLSAAHEDATSGKYDYVPVRIRVSDMNGRSIVQAQGLPTSGGDGDLTNDWDATEADVADAFAGTLVARTVNTYNDAGQQTSTERWTDADDGNDPKLTSTFGYDSTTGRQYKTQQPDGTITWTEVDELGRSIETWQGTDDSGGTVGDPSNGGANDMVRVSATFYDGAEDNGGAIQVGAGRVTQSRRYFGSGASDYLASDMRYDWRGRVVQSRGPDLRANKRTLDNLGRATTTEAYHDADEDFTLDTGELRGKQESFFDERGRTWKSVAHDVDDTGTVGNSLTQLSWYDDAGRQVKSADANGLFRKTAYDSAGRTVASYVSYDDGDSSHADALTVADDTVLQQSEIIYNGLGQQVAVTSFQRHYDDADDGTGTEGALSTTDSFYTVRVTWYDELGRTTHAADYGRDGDDPHSGGAHVYDASGDLIDTDTNGIPDVAETTAPEPDTSDDYRVTKTSETWQSSAPHHYRERTDNAGKTDRTVFDDLGRPVKQIENYADGTVTETETVTDRLTEREYDAFGRLVTLIAHHPLGSGNGVEQQKTRYLYTATVHGSWLTTTVYPDTTDVLSQDADDVWSFTTDNGDHVSWTYDRMGRRSTQTDQNGTVRTFSYVDPGNDGAGQLEADTVTTLGTGVDGAVRRIGTAYDELGRRTAVTSYSDTAGNTAVNEVAYTHGDWGTTTHSEQEHDGTVDGSTPAVQYSFDDGAGGGSDAKYVRQTRLTYPDGRQVDYTYAAGDWDHGKLGLVETIELDGTAAPDPTTSYQYLGSGTLVSETSTEPDVMRSTIGSDFDRLDRFGRVIDHRWTNAAETSTFDRFTYGHDRGGNRTFRDNELDADHGELYDHDDLHRLVDLQRGELNGTQDAIVTNELAFQQNWTLSMLGNWQSFDEDDDGDETWDLEQSRTHSEANEIDDIDETTGPSWSTPGHDDNGNMTSVPQPESPTSSYTATYDAWNRLVKLEDDDTSNTVAAYEYDGLNRRIVKKIYASGSLDETRHVYYSQAWQVLEVRVDGTADTDVELQYLWGQRYVDDLLARDRDTTGNGTLDERLYALQDANFNVTAIVDDTGDVVERYRYTPYGQRTVLDDDWTDDADGLSDYGFALGHQGLMHDAESGLIYNRWRMRHATLGRFMQRDPLNHSRPAGGYHDGVSLYQYQRSNPVRFLDSTGLETEQDGASCECICTTEPHLCSVKVFLTSGRASVSDRPQMFMRIKTKVELQHSEGKSVDGCHLRQDTHGLANFSTPIFDDANPRTEEISKYPPADEWRTERDYAPDTTGDWANYQGWWFTDGPSISTFFRAEDGPTDIRTFWWQAHVWVIEAESVETYWGFQMTGRNPNEFPDIEKDDWRGHTYWAGVKQSHFSTLPGNGKPFVIGEISAELFPNE